MSFKYSFSWMDCKELVHRRDKTLANKNVKATTEMYLHLSFENEHAPRDYKLTRHGQLCCAVQLDALTAA